MPVLRCQSGWDFPEKPSLAPQNKLHLLPMSSHCANSSVWHITHSLITHCLCSGQQRPLQHSRLSTCYSPKASKSQWTIFKQLWKWYHYFFNHLLLVNWKNCLANKNASIIDSLISSLKNVYLFSNAYRIKTKVFTWTYKILLKWMLPHLLLCTTLPVLQSILCSFSILFLYCKI